MAIILGIDPGSVKTGYGLIDVLGSRLSYIDSGVIRLPDASFPERLRIIAFELGEIVHRFEPVAASVEQVFLSNNASSALKLGQARGAAIVAAMQNNVPVSEYSARQIKQAVVGKGGADKNQVKYMVRLLLKLNFNPAEDAADALASAICHAHTNQSLVKISGASSVRNRRLR